MAKLPYGKIKRGYATVDKSILPELLKYSWFRTTQGYVATRVVENDKKRDVLLHRLILNAPEKMVVDHINGNGLDNRKANLRLCTQQQNTFNSKSTVNNKHGYKGIRFDKRQPRKGWIAQITFNRKNIYLGSHYTKEEAALTYNEAAKKYFGEFANLNIVGGSNGS